MCAREYRCAGILGGKHNPNPIIRGCPCHKRHLTIRWNHYFQWICIFRTIDWKSHQVIALVALSSCKLEIQKTSICARIILILFLYLKNCEEEWIFFYYNRLQTMLESIIFSNENFVLRNLGEWRFTIKFAELVCRDAATVKVNFAIKKKYATTQLSDNYLCPFSYRLRFPIRDNECCFFFLSQR